MRPAIITPEQVAAIRDQVIRINRDPESLPPEQRNVPGGAASLLVDHPAVIGVLQEIIGLEIRLESPGCVVREKGQRHGELHGGGPQQINPIFGYRTQDGKIHAGNSRPPPPPVGGCRKTQRSCCSQAWSGSSSSCPRSAKARDSPFPAHHCLAPRTPLTHPRGSAQATAARACTRSAASLFSNSPLAPTPLRPGQAFPGWLPQGRVPYGPLPHVS